MSDNNGLIYTLRVKHNGVVLIESHTAQFVELVYLMCSHTSKLILCVCFNVKLNVMVRSAYKDCKS